MVKKVVIDTNVLVASLSSRSPYHWLIRALLQKEFDLYLTTEIYLEYEEVLSQKYSSQVAHHFLSSLKELSNVHFVHVYFQWNLLDDADDNKFVDCYVSSGAHYLLTHDTDFNKLKSIVFPPVNLITLQDFQSHL
jgi:putative PIN family toxin of toxin-antitoxin system